MRLKDHVRHLFRLPGRAVSAASKAVPVVPRRAVVIDLDNVGPCREGHGNLVLDSILDAAGPYDVAIASGRDVSYQRYRSACSELGVQLIQAAPVKNGADKALLATARALASVGVSDFVIVSGDQIFEHLPGQVHVLMPKSREIAVKLQRRAATITELTLPPGAHGRSRSRPVAAR